MNPTADDLVFGTDGWRDRMDGRFTVDNVARAAQATADLVRARGGKAVVVAHDTRRGGSTFADVVATTLAANGVHVHLAVGPLPTPVLSFAVRHLGAAMGVMLTASHNPPAWNGFKLKGPYGGTATEDVYREVAARTAGTDAGSVRRVGRADAGISTLQIQDAYFAALTRTLDVRALRTLRGTVVHDAIGGAAAGWIEAFARHAGLPMHVEAVRGTFDPEFYGAHPEPIPAHLGPAIERMRPADALVAVATDGDGDRLGAVLPGGRPMTAHEIFALLVDRRARDGATGRVVKTFTVARLVERIATARGLPVTETPVGFKWLVEEMLRGDVSIAGEESGGIGLPDHLPERDGIANAFVLLQALAGAIREDGVTTRADGPLGARLAALQREVEWAHHYDRVDLALGDAHAARRAGAALAAATSSFAGRTVASIERRDGTKWNLTGGAWVLVRASGTEPLLRVYCEAQSPDEVAEILEATTATVLAAAGGRP